MWAAIACFTKPSNPSRKRPDDYPLYCVGRALGLEQFGPAAPAVMPDDTHNAVPAVAMARRRLDIRGNLNGSPLLCTDSTGHPMGLAHSVRLFGGVDLLGTMAVLGAREVGIGVRVGNAT